MLFGLFYSYFTIPLLVPLPDDTFDTENKENPLSYIEFLKIPKFLTTNLGLVMTLTANLFLLTGIVFGI